MALFFFESFVFGLSFGSVLVSRLCFSSGREFVQCSW